MALGTPSRLGRGRGRGGKEVGEERGEGKEPIRRRGEGEMEREEEGRGRGREGIRPPHIPWTFDYWKPRLPSPLTARPASSIGIKRRKIIWSPSGLFRRLYE